MAVNNPRLLFLILSVIFLSAHVSRAFKKQPRVDWFSMTQEELKEALKVQPNVGKAKNVIIFMGDGMGFSTIMAARVYNAQSKDLSFNEARLAFERFPYTGLSMTYNTDRMVTDSAGAGAAYLRGEKVQSRTIGVNQDVPLGSCDSVEGNTLTSVLHHSHSAGKWTGIVTTARLTHASPAQAYGVAPDRNWETDAAMPVDARGKCKDLASQLIDDHSYIRVLLGGGRQKFLPKTKRDPEYPTKMGQREDGRDLIQEWIDKKSKNEKVAYVRNEQEFREADPTSLDYLLGMFEPGHMKYEVDRLNESKSDWEEPSIEAMTIKAIRMLKRSPNGFFLFVEGGRIDHGHHAGNAFRALNDTLAFSEAVQAAVDMVDDRETLIITTADHSHVFTVGGLTPINNPIFGLAYKKKDGQEIIHIADDGLPFTILSYANGPSWSYHHTYGNGTIIRGRKNLTEDFLSGAMSHPDYLQDSPIPLIDETHGGEDVAIYGRGPMAHLLTGSHEQTIIAHVMMYASCVGPGLTWCNDPSRASSAARARHGSPGAPLSASLLAAILVLLARF